MELQFHKTALPGLQLVKREVRNMEETQDFRISDGMPDIGRVLGAWGQVLLRGKEWRSGSAHVSGGVQAWVLYIPEDEDGVRCVETWLPFQAKWELPELAADGTICASYLLRNVDARSTGSRKMMIRANVGILGEMWVPAERWQYSPGEIPEDICLLKQARSVCIPRETGEKPFVIEEELSIPASAPKLQKLLYCNIQPEMIEQKIMSDKIVFRGSAQLHVLYEGEDACLHTWDTELPFSQFSELENEYEQGAAAQITPAVTSLETDMDVEGRLCLKTGITGQYMIYDQLMLETVEDAYSPLRQVTPHVEVLDMPMVLDTQRQTVSAEQTVQAEGKMIDTAFFPDHPCSRQTDDSAALQLPGRFQLLYRDDDGHLQSTGTQWEGQWQQPHSAEMLMMANVTPAGRPQAAFDGTGILLHADMQVNAITVSQQGFSVVAGLEAGELTEADPARPNLILRKAGKSSLWEIAKQSGSTVEAIREANKLENEPAPDRMLLIPVL